MKRTLTSEVFGPRVWFDGSRRKISSKPLSSHRWLPVISNRNATGAKTVAKPQLNP
jgi:hypothetical protein